MPPLLRVVVILFAVALGGSLERILRSYVEDPSKPDRLLHRLIRGFAIALLRITRLILPIAIQEGFFHPKVEITPGERRYIIPDEDSPYGWESP